MSCTGVDLVFNLAIAMASIWEKRACSSCLLGMSQTYKPLVRLFGPSHLDIYNCSIGFWVDLHIYT